MNISSRTPEGEPNRCPICGHDVRMTPSEPSGDAPCPHCGSLLWFVTTPAGPKFFSKIVFPVTDARRIDTSGPDRERTIQAGTSRQNIRPPVHSDDRVRIVEGHFQNFEGVVKRVDPTNGRVMVAFNIFGRVIPVELELRQVESIG